MPHIEIRDKRGKLMATVDDDAGVIEVTEELKQKTKRRRKAKKSSEKREEINEQN